MENKLVYICATQAMHSWRYGSAESRQWVFPSPKTIRVQTHQIFKFELKQAWFCNLIFCNSLIHEKHQTLLRTKNIESFRITVFSHLSETSNTHSKCNWLIFVRVSLLICIVFFVFCSKSSCARTQFDLSHWAPSNLSKTRNLCWSIHIHSKDEYMTQWV